MRFDELIRGVAVDTLDVSLPLFAPELALCVAIIVLLLGRLTGLDRRINPHWLALVGAMVATGLAYSQFTQPAESVENEKLELFSGLLIYDSAAVYFRLLITVTLTLVVWLTNFSGIPDREDAPDYYSLLIGATIGAMLMASSNHLLMMFLAIEMTSVPSYALVGFLKGRRQSGEAALKYLVYGGGASGVLLYGCSLLAGATGTMLLPEVVTNLQALQSDSGLLNSTGGMTAALGMVMVVAGIAFKLALVPFQFWCPDAFEGASAETAGFLSVAPKLGAFALLVRVTWPMTSVVGDGDTSLGFSIGLGLAVLSISTMTLGNLAAYAQTDLKRLFAYSTIAHAGYMLMGPAAALTNPEDVSVKSGLEGLCYYSLAYVFMNLGAFAVIAIVRNRTFRVDIDGCRGLWRSLPLACVAMAVCIYGLIGLPPSGGFMGKFMVFYAALSAGYEAPLLMTLLVVAAVNTVISLFYYMRVLKAMFLDAADEGEPREMESLKVWESLFLLAVGIPSILLGIIVSPFSDAAAEAVRGFLS
ncbi:NADH-quinone oxidoreductase subunit N [Calycomorphotria hydatis]|uniref:NADH-quinone oxidoreductase subunit N n=1 Tax=Calycomorphotria hydatis TaxID=2528027 RepID=A0A517T6P1_9PLAN|nr:NADH-quinone oxidoreductase subunit N [Calycomorphotria hydatis]QDT64044.1 NADH-quinone oxidoreductase subunit N [Calycomorphotria hydatis]